MLSIPSALQIKLESVVSTLARAWIVRRRDGAVQGFTDHDRDLVVDGVSCRAGSGLSASEANSRFDLAVDGAEISGALADQSLDEADLAAGRYDAAAVETWLVDWSEPSLCVRLARATLGEVRREGGAFTAELRGPADRLSQESGRLYTARCSADLGDARCRADLTDPARHGTGSVAAMLSASAFRAGGLGAFADGVFSGGRLSWTDGANAGLSIEIKQHRIVGGEAELTLWQVMAEPIASGDAFTLTAGCDKTFATCRQQFANAANFRGFPQIPGNDFLLSSPTSPTGASLGLPA
jgi:uncharacterized phage protein (TIGR02218 family)